MATSRRAFIAGGVAAGGAAFTDRAFAQGAELPPTPECRDSSEATLRQTEGPFYKPRTPERSDLVEAGMSGRVIVLTGLVLTRRCQPVARALVDLWHADDKGEYDNQGFRLRGHQFTDAQGRYRFRTIVPAVYTGRTRHFHVKVGSAPYSAMLTTQLYFPNDPGNARDRLFRRELVMRVANAGEGVRARFDFVVDAG